MSKSLEALKHLVDGNLNEVNYYRQFANGFVEIMKDKEIIEKELEEYQQHEEILNDYGLTLANFREACLLLAQWKGAGLCWVDYEKQKKALEIITEKNVAITMIKQTQSVAEYNMFAYDFLQVKRVDKEKYELSPQPLDEKEYNLLKELLL